MLVERTLQHTNLAGYFWVLESSADHGCHAHIVFYLDRHCSGQLKLATALEFFQYRFSDSFGGNPPL